MTAKHNLSFNADKKKMDNFDESRNYRWHHIILGCGQSIKKVGQKYNFV